MRVLILVVGGLVVAFCLLVAIKPGWFGRTAVVGRNRQGQVGAMRLAEASVRSVRIGYLMVAAAVVVLTLFAYARVDARLSCAQARSVYEAGHTPAEWQAEATRAGLQLVVSDGAELDVYTLLDGDRVVGRWSVGRTSQLSCG